MCHYYDIVVKLIFLPFSNINLMKVFRQYICVVFIEMAVLLLSFSLINIVRHWTAMFLRPGYLSYIKTQEVTYVSQVNMKTRG